MPRKATHPLEQQFDVMLLDWVATLGATRRRLHAVLHSPGKPMPTDPKPSRKFERDFMRRTLTILREYHGPYDATILLNCMLGLLIVPREALINTVPLDAAARLIEWGIAPSSIQSFERVTHNNKHPETIRGVIRSLRNAVAHFAVTPVHENRQVKGFLFETSNGFRATITLTELRIFVERLAEHVEAATRSEGR